MLSRFLASLLIAGACVTGCADPPGTPKPLPLNYQEEAQAVEVYRKYQPQLQGVEGVQETYLTAHNNPRRLVVVVKDEATVDRVRGQFGKTVDGLKLKFRIADSETPHGGPVEKVPKMDQPTTWWGKIVWYIGLWREQWLGGEKK